MDDKWMLGPSFEPIDTFFPERKDLRRPLSCEVVKRMALLDLGTTEEILSKLRCIVDNRSRRKPTLFPWTDSSPSENADEEKSRSRGFLRRVSGNTGALKHLEEAQVHKIDINALVV
jgi:hypothetical protein